MVLGAREVHIPNVMQIDAGLLRVMLNEAGVSREQWVNTD